VLPEPGVVVYLHAECRDIGYGVETIIGEHYIYTGEIDTWGKHTFVSAHGEDTVYLFADEILETIPVYPVRV
jgi:hypothetical protein